jgi:hypothetical protein
MAQSRQKNKIKANPHHNSHKTNALPIRKNKIKIKSKKIKKKLGIIKASYIPLPIILTKTKKISWKP